MLHFFATNGQFSYNQSMIKTSCFFLLFCLIGISFAQVNELQDIISDPAVSRRCKALLNERGDKVRIIQSNQALILRNKRLQKALKKRQQTLRSKLELNLVQLKNNLRLAKISLKSMEENIIRKGCPGLAL